MATPRVQQRRREPSGAPLKAAQVQPGQTSSHLQPLTDAAVGGSGPSYAQRITPPGSRKDLKTLHGHPLDEASSALQKACRRGEEPDVLYWLALLDLSGFAKYAWRRLTTIAVEDVGLGDGMVIVQVRALHDAWRELSVKPGKHERICLMQAGMVVARAPKSRMVDDSLVVYEEIESGDLAYRLEVPDHAVDMFTARGRAMGRGLDFFYDESAKLGNEAHLDNPYAERVDTFRARNRQDDS